MPEVMIMVEGSRVVVVSSVKVVEPAYVVMVVVESLAVPPSMVLCWTGLAIFGRWASGREEHERGRCLRGTGRCGYRRCIDRIRSLWSSIGTVDRSFS